MRLTRTSAGGEVANVFWVKRGTWRRFGIEVGEDGVKVQPPPECADVLREILATE
jgi:hypothetical protein